MGTTSIRWQAAKRLVDLIQAHPNMAGVQVEPGWPGDTQQAESVWIESLTGTETVPYMKGGARVVTDDRFDIPLQIRVANRADLDATGTRLAEIVGAVQDIVKDDPSLGFTPADMLEVDLGEVDLTLGRTPEGVFGFARMTIAAHARYF